MPASASPALTSSLRRSTIAAGVPRGTPTPVQDCTAKPGRVSPAAGTSGSVGLRLADSTARPRTAPARMCGSELAGVEVVRVPYPGGAPMLTDLMSGRVQAGVDALPNSLPHIRAGAVRGLAVLSAKRSPTLPDVPAAGETLPGFAVQSWTGVGVPRGTPAAIVERLNDEVNAGLADAGIKARLAEVGGAPLVYTSSQFAQMIARDAEKWRDVIKRAGIQPE